MTSAERGSVSPSTFLFSSFSNSDILFSESEPSSSSSISEVEMICVSSFSTLDVFSSSSSRKKLSCESSLSYWLFHMNESCYTHCSRIEETTKNDVYEQTLPYKENPLGVLTIWKSVKPLDAVYNLLSTFIVTFVFNSLLRILVRVFKMDLSPSSMTASNRSRFSTL